MQHKILVVDDKPENIRALMEALKDDYALVAATSGEKALELARKEPMPDLILLDVIMPEMDGFQVCRTLKADLKTKHIPVIFVTTINEASEEEIGLSVGAIDYLNKPIVPDLVRARVRNHLALKAYQDDLEKKVAEETARRLEQQQLLVRQSRLAAMGEMMSAITHQWSQPLNVVNMAADMIRGGLKEEEVIEQNELEGYLKTIKSSVAFMAQTMHDFKNYFKPNKNKYAFGLKNEIETMITMLTSQLKHVSISTHVDVDESIQVVGIPSEFKQVVLNLISNAKDAIKSKTNGRGPGEIRFSGREETDTVVLEVEDSGGGIPEEVIHNIFDDYFTTKGDDGTGIGLAMSKMIIEDGMGGNISVSNAEKGARFIIKLPKSEV